MKGVRAKFESCALWTTLLHLLNLQQRQLLSHLINKGLFPEKEFVPQSMMSSGWSLLGERGLSSVWWESLQLCSWWQPVLWERPR